MNFEFPSVTLSLDDEAIIVHSVEPMMAITSSITGGGILPARYILNMRVDKNYNCNSPADDLVSFARSRGINESFHGFMTAVYLNKTKSVTLREQDVTVTALVTTGVSNATPQAFLSLHHLHLGRSTSSCLWMPISRTPRWSMQ